MKTFVTYYGQPVTDYRFLLHPRRLSCDKFPPTLLFLPDQQHVNIDRAGFATVAGLRTKLMADDCNITRYPDGLIGQVNCDEIRFPALDVCNKSLFAFDCST